MTSEHSVLPSVECPAREKGVYWVYLLQSMDGALYVGQTNDVDERLRKHRLGLGSKHTHDHPGVRLVYLERHFSLQDGVTREAQLKRWSRTKKIALIGGNAAQLHELSRSHD